MPGYNPYNYNAPYPYGGYMPQIAPQNISMQNVPPMTLNPQNAPVRPIQDGGFVRVNSIAEAQNYPVEPGKCITFIIGNAENLCTKTLGYSPLEQPQFKAFQLKEITNETSQVAETTANNATGYATKEELEEVKEKLQALKDELKNYEVGA